jgi:hypothetical protein
LTTPYDNKELDILRVLDQAVREPSAAQALAAAAARVEETLSKNPEDVLAWESIPLSVYSEKLPPVIRSNWVFAIRAGSDSGAERHPNSHQRMMSLRGFGDFPTRSGKEWISHPLTSDADAAMEKRWISIPANVWHRAVVSDKNWVVVSFHTVPAEDLIEERPGEFDEDTVRKRKYLEE